MAQPYSDDLRCKLLQAYTAGKGTLEELAERFGVSYGYTRRSVSNSFVITRWNEFPKAIPGKAN